MNQLKSLSFGTIAIVLLLGLTIFSPITLVPNGTRGVETVFGKVQDEALDPGIHVINPMARVHNMDVQVQKFETTDEGASKDLQHVSTALAVNYHLSPSATPGLYRDVGMDYEARLLQAAVQDSFKSVTARYTAEELITKRDDVRLQMKQELTQKVGSLSSNSIAVDDIFITNFDFSKEFNNAIEAKQESEQRAQKAQNDLARVKIEAEQRVAGAEAEAKAIQIQAGAIAAQGGAAYVQMKAVEKWDGKMPVYMLGGNTTPFVNVSTGK